MQRDERNLCVLQTCQEEFRVDKDACRNVDHDCAEACRAGFETCVEPFLTTLADCKAACQSDSCKLPRLPAASHYPVQGRPARDTCIDQARLRLSSAGISAARSSFRLKSMSSGFQGLHKGLSAASGTMISNRTLNRQRSQGREYSS